MSVRFVIGRAGSGKTRHVFRSMVDAMRADPLGPPIYLILPKQATFSAERELTCNSGLGGFCRAHVLSFDELSRTVLAECGGGAIPEVTPIGRQMLLGHLLRKNTAALTFYDGVARQPGLAARLDAMFDEFQRSGKDPAALNELVDELNANATDAEGELLLRKMRDFRLLYTEYTAFLGQDRVDPHGRLTQMLQCLQDSSAFRGATVYVDGFAEFTDSERRTLARLARFAPRMNVALLVDPSHPTIRDVHHLPETLDPFHQTLQTYRQLHFAFEIEGVAIGEPLVLNEPARFAQQKPLAYVERHLFTERAKPLHGDVPVELIEAHDRRAEVDVVARRVRELLAEDVRLRQIAVLVRDLEPYHELIDASFREHAIPYFVDRRRTAAHHPLLVFTRAVLAIARSGAWPHESIVALLKSGLADVTPDEADEVENYVLLHRVKGHAWGDAKPWFFERKQTRGRGDDDLPDVEAIEAARVDRIRRRVVDRLRVFIAAIGVATDVRPLRQTVLDLFQLYESFGVRKTLATWIDEAADANELEQRGEHEQVWSELVSLLDQMVDLLGDEPVTIGDFTEILEAGLEQFDLALTPPTVDQVLVGQVDRTRCPPLHTAFLVGLHEGEFPRAVREDSILSDSERERLQQRAVDLEPDSERRLLNENLLGYIAFTRASRRIIVTRATSDDAGKPLGPSPYWFRLRRLLPDVEPREIRRDADPADTIGTPRQMVNALVHWARSGATENAHAPWPALYQWLATYTCCDDVIDVMRYRAWRALGYANDANLSADVAGKLFAAPLHASVTRIESFATCPFKHFAQYGLRLRPRDDADVTAMDLGNVYHSILERVVREVLKTRADWADLEASVTDAMIREYAEEVGRSLRGELMMSSARNRYLLGHIEKTLNRVIASQRAAMRRGKFRPAVAELGFGVEGGTLPPFQLKTPAGRDVFLHGKIDRVDVVEGGAQFAVIDYKLTGRPLALDRVYHGISLQLLTYLLVLDAEGERVFGRKLTPSAAFYVKLLRSLDEVKHPDLAPTPDDPTFDLKEKPRGIFDGACVDHLDDECVKGGQSEVVQLYVKKDGDFGNLDRSDVADSDAFVALLAHVRTRVGELADEIIAGRVDIAPYRINKLTPCPQCDFRAVCRFDPGINRYHVLQPMKRSEVFERVTRGNA